MINITMNAKGAIDRNTLLSINDSHTQGVKNAQNIETINNGHKPPSIPRTGSASPAPATNTSSPAAQVPDRSTPVQKQAPDRSAPVQKQAPDRSAPAQKQIPPLLKPVQKGQKTALASAKPLNAIHACFGWNTTNSQCDVDVSAFLLNENGQVLGDSWFVFYGQTTSPDQSAAFHMAHTTDREIISIQFQKLNPAVKKIVFVLTINDAFEKKLNFGMMKDAYVRILDASDQTELVSFQMTDYYSNVISMMIGEIYLHNGAWKFNAIGNGVAKDLAGLCTLYGVEVSN